MYRNPPVHSPRPTTQGLAPRITGPSLFHGAGETDNMPFLDWVNKAQAVRVAGAVPYHLLN